MSVHGKTVGGKQELRKEIAQIEMMHPRTYVAQTTCAHTNHFDKSVLGALEFGGPAIVVCHTTCQPEHGVADNMAEDQARLAVDSRAFPLLTYDPRPGDTVKKRMSLQGNANVKDDWFVNPKTNETVTLIDFARSEGPRKAHSVRRGKGAGVSWGVPAGGCAKPAGQRRSFPDRTWASATGQSQLQAAARWGRVDKTCKRSAGHFRTSSRQATARGPRFSSTDGPRQGAFSGPQLRHHPPEQCTTDAASLWQANRTENSTHRHIGNARPQLTRRHKRLHPISFACPIFSQPCRCGSG
jgi:hypothetical protein